MLTRISIYDLVKAKLTLPFLGSDAECGGGSASFWGVDLDHRRSLLHGSHFPI